MPHYDIVVVGAGPAGGQCARLLSKAGYQVLVIDQARSFTDNNYSSAGTILSFLKDFNIPETVIGSYWQHLKIFTDKQSYVWQTPANQGVVLDFAKLRQFLVDEVVSHGNVFKSGVKYKSHELSDHGGYEVSLFDRNTKEMFTVHAKLLVDATGAARAVIGKKNYDHYTQAYGQEYLIKTTREDHEIDNHLVFMLGKSWVAQGYAWIFPMGNCEYKVGAATFQLHEEIKLVKMKSVIEDILSQFFSDNPYEILDKHGGEVDYCHPKKECFYKDGVVAVGDTVSAINILGGEGIRHGMVSADFAAQAIQQFLTDHSSRHFKGYRKNFLRYVKYKWWLCEVYAKRYYDFDRTDIDGVMQRLQHKPYELMKALLFDYDFMLIIKRYSRGRLKHLWNLMTRSRLG